MFSNNRKVSNRQITRIIIMDFFGVIGLIIPTELARTAGKDGTVSLVLGGGVACLFALFLCAILKQNSLESSNVNEKGPLFYIGSVFYLVHFLIVAAFLACLLAEVVQDMFLLESSRNSIMLVSLLLCSYGVKKGIESRGRICEITFYFVVFPLVIMIALASKDVNFDYLAPMLTKGVNHIALGSYYVFAGFSSLSVLALMGNFIREPKTVGKALLKGIGSVTILNLCLYVIALGFFQEGAMQMQRWPGITLISVLNTPGGFLQRYDAFLVAVFLISILIGLSSCISYGGYLFQELRGKRNSLMGFLFTAGVFLLAFWLNDYTQAYRIFTFYLWYIGTPIMVILPVLFMITRVDRGTSNLLFWKRRDKNA